MDGATGPEDDYYGWDEIQDQNFEPDNSGQIEESIEELNADFLAEEKTKLEEEREKTDILNSIQARVELEFHENDNTIIYGIIDDEIFPAIVEPSGDGSYASEDWVENKSEHMTDLQFFKDRSNAEIGNIGYGMTVDMPEGLTNYAEAIVDEVEGEFDEHDWPEANGTYIMPILSEERYREA